MMRSAFAVRSISLAGFAYRFLRMLVDAVNATCEKAAERGILLTKWGEEVQFTGVDFVGFAYRCVQ